MPGKVSRENQRDVPALEDIPGILILVGNFAIMELAAHAQVTQDQVGSGAELAGLEQEVVGLDICMDDAAGVQMGQSLRHLRSDIRELELPQMTRLSVPEHRQARPSAMNHVIGKQHCLLLLLMQKVGTGCDICIEETADVQLSHASAI